MDRYPHAGRFATSAMAEGAIEGTAAMYEMDSPYATHFKFSRFDAMSLQARPPTPSRPSESPGRHASPRGMAAVRPVLTPVPASRVCRVQ